MTTTIIPVDQLRRVMTLVTTRSDGAVAGLSEADRRLVEAVLGSACHGPAARDEYLAALARSAAVLPAETAVVAHDPAAWEVLLRDGLPTLSGRDLLTVAASPDTIRELNHRVGVALCDGTLTDVWWSHYEIPAESDPPNPALDKRVRDTVEVFRRLHAERSGRAEAQRPTTIAASVRILLMREAPPLQMAAAGEAKVVRFFAPDGPVLEVHPSHRPGLSELCLVSPSPDAMVDLFVDGVAVPLVAPFDRDGLATAQTADVTPALHGRARLELRFGPAADSSEDGTTPQPLPEGRP